MSTLSSIASIGVGATVGATCRYYIGTISAQYFGKDFPYGTLISNVIGSFIAGVLIVFVLEKFLLNETYRLMLLCLLYTSPSPRDRTRSRMPSSA